MQKIKETTSRLSVHSGSPEARITQSSNILPKVNSAKGMVTQTDNLQVHINPITGHTQHFKNGTVGAAMR